MVLPERAFVACPLRPNPTHSQAGWLGLNARTAKIAVFVVNQPAAPTIASRDREGGSIGGGRPRPKRAGPRPSDLGDRAALPHPEYQSAIGTRARMPGETECYCFREGGEGARIGIDDDAGHVEEGKPDVRPQRVFNLRGLGRKTAKDGTTPNRRLVPVAVRSLAAALPRDRRLERKKRRKADEAMTGGTTIVPYIRVSRTTGRPEASSSVSVEASSV